MKKKLYFAEREEQAVIDYILSDTFDEKNRIYNNILREPFQKMIQSILRRYPIHIGSYEMEEVEAYALSHLIEQMVKYKPFIIEYKKQLDEKWLKMGKSGRFIYYEDAKEKLDNLREKNDNLEYQIFYAKAYSYCQTIVRNYFRDHGRKTYSKKKTDLFYDDFKEEINKNSEYHYELENEDHHFLDKLIDNVVSKIEKTIDYDYNILKKNEIVVGEAIINVLNNWNYLFLEDSPQGKYNKKVTNKFAKNKILFYLKEQTGLGTKEIRMSMKPFKDIYFLEKNEFFSE